MAYALRTALLACLVLGPIAAAQAANEGQADLDKATEAKLTASTLSDLAEVIGLCEAALSKGLDEESTRFANRLLASALTQRGETLSAAILRSSPPDPRWPQFRRIALDDLERTVSLSPGQPEALFLIAQLNLLPGGDQKRAAGALDESIAASKDQPPFLANALLLRAELQLDPDKKRADLDEAVRTAPHKARALRSRGQFYATSGKPEKALDDFQASLKLDPHFGPVYEAQSLLLADLGRYDEALASLDKAAELAPESVTPLTLRARVYAKQSDYQAALTQLDKAAAIQPDNIFVLLMRAEVYSNLKENAKALADVDRVLQLKPLLQTAWRFRALLLAQADRLDEAIAELKRVAEAAPKDVQTRLQLAMLFSAQKKPRTAIKIYDKVLDEEPENTDALIGRADALLTIGDHAPAIADYDKALKRDPTNVGALNNMAWVLATSPSAEFRDGKRAVELANKAGERTDFKKAYILSTIAAAYAETGDFASAVEWSEKALKLGEKDQKDDLAKELASFKEGKPWRERLTSDDQEEPQSTPQPAPADLPPDVEQMPVLPKEKSPEVAPPDAAP